MKPDDPWATSSSKEGPKAAEQPPAAPSTAGDDAAEVRGEAAGAAERLLREGLEYMRAGRQRGKEVRTDVATRSTAFAPFSRVTITLIKIYTLENPILQFSAHNFPRSVLFHGRFFPVCDTLFSKMKLNVI
jgi:hypothetical protein